MVYLKKNQNIWPSVLVPIPNANVYKNFTEIKYNGFLYQKSLSNWVYLKCFIKIYDGTVQRKCVREYRTNYGYFKSLCSFFFLHSSAVLSTVFVVSPVFFYFFSSEVAVNSEIVLVWFLRWKKSIWTLRNLTEGVRHQTSGLWQIPKGLLPNLLWIESRNGVLPFRNGSRKRPPIDAWLWDCHSLWKDAPHNQFWPKDETFLEMFSDFFQVFIFDWRHVNKKIKWNSAKTPQRITQFLKNKIFTNDCSRREDQTLLTFTTVPSKNCGTLLGTPQAVCR